MDRHFRIGDLMKRLDRLTAVERSYVMSKVRNAGTGPELVLRRALWVRGARYLTPAGYKRKYKHQLVGRPDIIFPGVKVAVFVDGCFWHGCPLKCKGEPATNQDFWRVKIETNRARDQEVNRRLEELGWLVRRYWEHEVRRVEELDRIVTEVLDIVAERRAARN